MAYLRVKPETVKKWGKGAGIPIVFLALLYLIYSTAMGAFTIIDYSGNITCEGTDADPCVINITFIANKNVYWYPMPLEDIPKGALNTDKPIKDVKVYRTWGTGLKEINLNKTWNKDVKYAVKWSTGRIYTLVYYIYKNHPSDKIKWSFDEVDPYLLPFIYNKGDDNLNISYRLIIKDDEICGRAYTPVCVFNKDTLEKDMKIEYMKEYQESVPDYKKVCNPYNITIPANITNGTAEQIVEYKNCTQIVSGSHLENTCGWFELKDIKTTDKKGEKGVYDYFDISSGECHLVWKQSISGKDAKEKTVLNTDNLKANFSFFADEIPTQFTVINRIVDVIPSLTITDKKSIKKVFEMKEMANWTNTGGTITYWGKYTIHTFTSNGTFSVVGTGGNVSVLVVGGGGGGGCFRAGGGGAGGLVYNGNKTVSVGDYTVTIGSGGAGSISSDTKGGNGADSTFGDITAVGGGGGGSYQSQAGVDGGSGGGGSDSSSGGSATQGDSGGGTGYGNAGGTGASSAGAGGGGGAGAVGADGTNNYGANGGIGKSYDINGTNGTVYYAGGGGGGGYYGGGEGGSGGGGNGGIYSGGIYPTPGENNTGGGGGGGADQTGENNKGCSGGSGIVIIRYITELANTAPTIEAKTLTPASPTITDELIIEVNATDPDAGDPLSMNISFIDNSTQEVLYSINQSFTSGVNVTATLLSGNTTYSQRIYGRVDAYDGIAHTIENISEVQVENVIKIFLRQWAQVDWYNGTTINWSLTIMVFNNHSFELTDIWIDSNLTDYKIDSISANSYNETTYIIQLTRHDSTDKSFNLSAPNITSAQGGGYDNFTGTGNRLDLINPVDPATKAVGDVNYTLGPGETDVFRFTFGIDNETYPANPDNQTVIQSIINATNNGTGTADFEIRIDGTPHTNWTLFACNASSTDPYNDNQTKCTLALSTTYQDIWGGVTVNETKKIWMYANISFVSYANPGVSIEMKVSA